MAGPTREELVRLRESGMTREDLAEHYDVGVSTIRRWIKERGVPRPTPSSRRRRLAHLSSNGEIIAPPDDGKTIIEKARLLLGTRFSSHRDGYKLDGKPASTAIIVHAAGLKFRDEI